MEVLIIYFVIGLIPLFQAIRIKRNPEKVRAMQKVKEEQRGPEYEARMQMYGFVNYLVTSVMWMLTGLIGWLLGLNLSYIMLVLGMILGLMLILVKRHLTGEVYAWHWVLFAIGIAVIVMAHLWLRNISRVEVQADKLSMEGGYEQEIYYPSIDSVWVVDELPRTRYSMYGHSYLGSKKGEFHLKDGSNARFYVLSKKAPYIELYTQKGRFFVNGFSTEETEQLIEELRDKVGEKFVN